MQPISMCKFVHFPTRFFGAIPDFDAKKDYYKSLGVNDKAS